MQKFLRRLYSDFKEYIVAISLLLISLFLLTTNENKKVQTVRTYSLGLFAVFHSAVNEVSSIFNNDSELERLEKLNAELMLKVNRLREYGLENIELKRMLDLKDTTKYELIPSTIISKLVSSVQGNFIINVGRDDSVKVGMPVITDKGLAGLVTDVSGDFSLVRTLNNSTLKITVRDQRSNVNGIMTWNGSNLVIRNIPTTYDVSIGDRVVTSDFSTVFPPSIPVGIIVRKETNILGILNNLTVQPFVELESIKNVFVLQILISKQVDELELNLIKGR